MALLRRALPALLAVLPAAPALAQGGLQPPAGRLPPVHAPAEASPKSAVPVEPPTPPARGAVLEQVTGTVKDVDRTRHRIVVDAGGAQPVTLSLDRNTMVYTAAGLGTVRDVVPGAQIRAGRNADMVAYWVQVRPTAPPGAPSPTPDQGTGPGGGAGVPASEPRGGSIPAPPAGAAGPTGPGIPGAGAGPR